MKLKFFVAGLTLLLAVWGHASHNYIVKTANVEEAAEELFFQSGEWPLPVRVAPFPIRDIVGGWDLGPNKPVLEISRPVKGPNGFHVDITLVDKVTQKVIANGPARVIGDVLVADNIRLGPTKIYMQMVSLIPPKNSVEDRNQEKVVYMYIHDKQDRSRRAQFRIKKVYNYNYDFTDI